MPAISAELSPALQGPGCPVPCSRKEAQACSSPGAGEEAALGADLSMSRFNLLWEQIYPWLF